MSEVRLPLSRGASAPTHTTTPSTANMVAQRGLAFESDDGGEDRSTNGQQVDENDQNEDTARLAVVERRLDQQDRERREYEARMTQMMGQLMNMLNPGTPAAIPAATTVTSAATLGAPGRAADPGPDQADDSLQYTV